MSQYLIVLTWVPSPCYKARCSFIITKKTYTEDLIVSQFDVGLSDFLLLRFIFLIYLFLSFRCEYKKEEQQDKSSNRGINQHPLQLLDDFMLAWYKNLRYSMFNLWRKWMVLSVWSFHLLSYSYSSFSCRRWKYMNIFRSSQNVVF